VRLQIYWVLIGLLVVENRLMWVRLSLSLDIRELGRRDDSHGRVDIIESDDFLRYCLNAIVEVVQSLFALIYVLDYTIVDVSIGLFSFLERH
jgi:hypothetical protein